MGDVVEFPLRVLYPSFTAVFDGWEAAFGRAAGEPTRFGG
jgi:hypothetical protein